MSRENMGAIVVVSGEGGEELSLVEREPSVVVV